LHEIIVAIKHASPWCPVYTKVIGLHPAEKGCLTVSSGHDRDFLRFPQTVAPGNHVYLT